MGLLGLIGLMGLLGLIGLMGLLGLIGLMGLIGVLWVSLSNRYSGSHRLHPLVSLVFWVSQHNGLCS